ncbi:MAG: FtsQ-type POTRA domain-containing protein [Deltaproteobacteria bacterium]|nr:FtsQ-type POTRA domain-containing protein [Deltaproteobacteria bacterium]MCL5277844.1 FtsQ-type POTRA domain-containing protein [Deltaproteobacteria bacterium]
MNRLLPSDFNARLKTPSNLRWKKHGGRDVYRYRVRVYLRYVFLIAAIVIAAAGGRAFYAKAVHFIGSSRLFALKEVQVQGYERVLPAEIIGASGLTFGQNIFSIRFSKVVGNIMSIPWISSVSIRELPPHKIDISVTERKAFCMILLDRLYYVDDSGIIFKRVDEKDPVNYPVITGLDMGGGHFMDVPIGAVADAVSFIKELDRDSSIDGKDVSELHVDATGYSIVTSGGLIVRFGTDGAASGMNRLNAIMDHFGNEVQTFSVIDLRFAGMGVIRYRNGLAEGRPFDPSLRNIKKEVNSIEKTG